MPKRKKVGELQKREVQGIIRVVFIVSLIASLVLVFGDYLLLFDPNRRTSGRLELVTFSALAVSGAALMLQAAWHRARGGSQFYKAMFWFLIICSAVLFGVMVGFGRLTF